MNLKLTDAKLVQTQPVERPASQRPATENIISESMVLLVSLSLGTIWLGVIILALYISRVMQGKETASFKSPQKYPCKSCRFYSDNPYLRCAVNPASAMTEAANDCTDFRSTDRRCLSIKA